MSDNLAGRVGNASAMSEGKIAEVFESFVRCFRERDMAALATLWTPEFRVWHSVDCQAKDRDEYLAFIAKLPRRHPRFVDVQRDYFLNGFVQQQAVEITQPDGRVDRSRMCLVVRMENDLISRIDEYASFGPASS